MHQILSTFSTSERDISEIPKFLAPIRSIEMVSSKYPFIFVAVWFSGAFFTLSYAAEALTSQNATVSSLPVDATYVIGMKQCEERWNRAFAWARANKLQITPVYGTHFGEIDLRDPPIPVNGLMKNDVVMSGQVACTMSHIRAWRDAFMKNYSRIVVLEDDVRFSNALLQRLPDLLTNADEGSARRHNDPWHYIYLRMYPTVHYNKNHWQVWHHDLRVAPPGWGTAAYILSEAGVRYLLTRVTSYSHPLDVQLERLQRGLDNDGAHFVALTACPLDQFGEHPLGCPANIHELRPTERGNCVYSGTQAGQGFFGKQMPGANA